MLKNFTNKALFSSLCNASTLVRPLGVPRPKVAEANDSSSVCREKLLRYRTALVTNCDSTHGELPSNVCFALANYGANVLIQGDNEQKLAQIFKSLPIVHEQQNHAYLVHPIASETNNIKLGEEVRNFTESLEIVVHNSGDVNIPVAFDTANFDINKFDTVVRQSLTTPYALFQSIQPLVMAGNNPSVIFCSLSPQHETTENKKEPHDSAYYVSKFGYNSSRMLTKMLSESMAKRGVRINTVDPGRFLSHGNETLALGGKSNFGKTNAFVWLARPDTEMNGSQLDATEWIRRDPIMFKSFY